MANMANKVELTLSIQKDRENVQSVKKVSDKMYSIKSMLSTGKNSSGEWNPGLFFDVHAFTKESKAPTKMNGFIPEAGKKFTVTGSLTAVKSGNFTNMVILAREITEFVPEEKPEEASNEVETADPWS